MALKEKPDFRSPDDYIRRIDQDGVTVFVINTNLLSPVAVDALRTLGQTQEFDQTDPLSLTEIREANQVVLNETGFTGDQLIAARNAKQTRINNFLIRYADYLN